MLPHVNSDCKSAFCHLRNISGIRKLLSHKTTETLVHAFVTSTLDHCTLFVPKYVIKKLQSIENAAARLITSSRKYDHITPILFDLHWLPEFTHKALHRQSPIYIQDLIRSYSKRSGHLQHYAWVLSTLISSRMALELLLFPPLNCGTKYLKASVLETI